MGLNGNNGWTSDDAELTGGTQLEHHLPHNEGVGHEKVRGNVRGSEHRICSAAGT